MVRNGCGLLDVPSPGRPKSGDQATYRLLKSAVGSDHIRVECVGMQQWRGFDSNRRQRIPGLAITGVRPPVIPPERDGDRVAAEPGRAPERFLLGDRQRRTMPRRSVASSDRPRRA
jgi:hypothetical protein